MISLLNHRGPDDAGITLIDPVEARCKDFRTDDSEEVIRDTYPCLTAATVIPHRIALGHCRFSIIDPSPLGHQPFWSVDRTVCAAFNGEIYNYVELRQELSQHYEFRTNSDTEVLVAAYQQWGEECVQRFNGFFAITLYDTRRRQLWLARDRIGKAPLYLARIDGTLVWGSEIKAIRSAFADHNFRVRDQAVVDFVRGGNRDLFDETFFEGIETFPKACTAWIDPDGTFKPKPYWSLPTERLSERDISPSEAATELAARLNNAVRLRMRADVPIGVELSGGMDSSSIVALATRHADRVHTFTVSFPGTAFDEEPYARQVARRYSKCVDYTVLKPTPLDFAQRADDYIALMDEPFHAPNMLTNHDMWRKMSRQGIRVSLNGGGADELFAGYPGVYWLPYMRRLLGRMKWRTLAAELRQSTERWATGRAKNMLPTALGLFPRRIRRLKRLVRNGRAFSTFSNDPFIGPCLFPRESKFDDIHNILLDNMGHWLMNYWMRSGNTSFMGVPIEVRFPFLDHRVVEFAFSLPISYLIRDGWHKWILRQGFQNDLPTDVVFRRQKMGFPFPLSTWLIENSAWLQAAVAQADCPYLDLACLRDQYDKLANEAPEYLWRMLCLGLWWRRCVTNASLLA